MKKTFRQYAIDYIKNRRLCKGYVDYIISQLDKLEKIEQIINDYDTNCGLEEYMYLEQIKEVLENE